MMILIKFIKLILMNFYNTFCKYKEIINSLILIIKQINK